MSKDIVTNATKIAHTGDWELATDAAWKNPSPRMDWMGFEATLRAYVKYTHDERLDEIVAAFTRRGHVLIFP